MLVVAHIPTGNQPEVEIDEVNSRLSNQPSYPLRSEPSKLAGLHLNNWAGLYHDRGPLLYV
jgi:hypothetical protein